MLCYGIVRKMNAHLSRIDRNVNHEQFGGILLFRRQLLKEHLLQLLFKSKQLTDPCATIINLPFMKHVLDPSAEILASVRMNSIPDPLMYVPTAL